MKEIQDLFQAIVILIVGVILFSALGAATLANQFGALGILLIVIAVIVIIAKIIFNFMEEASGYL